MKRKLLLMLMATFATVLSYGQYCAADGGGDEYISGVEIGTISNTGTGEDGYTDYTATLSTDLYQGETGVSITVTNGNGYGADDLGIWIDWNQDGDFSDTDEEVVCDAGNGGEGIFTFDVPAGAILGNTVMRVRIKYSGSDCGSPCGSTSYGEVEDYTINVTSPPSCLGPASLTIPSNTAITAELEWTQVSGSTGYNWEVVASGGTPGTGSSVANGSTSAGNDTTATATGLSANTTYDAYVQNDCGSSWTGPTSFTTSALTTTIPLTEDFEGNSFGSYIQAASGDQSDIFINTASANASTYGVQMEGKTSSGWTGGSTSTTESQAWNDNASHISAMNITVDATAETVVMLEFDLKQTYSYGAKYSWFRVVVNGTQIGSSYNPASQNSDAFQTLSYDLSAYAGTTFNLSLQHSGKYNNSSGSGTPGGDNAYVDNLSITAPSCFKPTGLAISEITTTTARLAWNAATGGTGYDWEVVPMGNAQGSGVVANGNTADTTAVASGLSAATSYDAYVQTDCGSGYIGPVTFTTECPAKVTTFPYTTDFENAGSIANCWTNDPTDAGGEWEFTTNNSHGPSADHTSGSGYYALLDDYWTSTSNSPFNLLTPIFDLSTTNKWYKVSYWAWIGPDGATNPIYFEVSLDGGTTWKTLYTHDHSTTGSWFNVSIDLGFNKSDNVQFRFKANSIYGYGTNNSGIDDFTIEETQAPPVPLSDWAVYIGIFFILVFTIVAYRRRLA